MLSVVAFERMKANPRKDQRYQNGREVDVCFGITEPLVLIPDIFGVVCHVVLSSVLEPF